MVSLAIQFIFGNAKDVVLAYCNFFGRFLSISKNKTQLLTYIQNCMVTRFEFYTKPNNP